MPAPPRTVVIAFAVSIAIVTSPADAASHPAFEVPPGFEVTQYATDDLAHNIFSMTIDARGRVVVAGPGYVKILHDTDDDGVADKATLFSPVPRSGAHGMYFDGNDLIATGDNALMRLRDADGDGKADNPDNPQVLAKLRHPEHGANGVVKGPDGWYFVICGNDAGVTAKLITATISPVTKPEQGAVVRFSPDGKQADIVAHGFRNPYDLAFNRQGNLFTVDADGERDQHLPWYAPTRLFDIGQGMHHGWVLGGWKRSWSRPAYFLDSMERVAEIGRGSPTGVVCYRHTAYPHRYRNGVFSACWTLGRVYFFPLEPWGSTFAPSSDLAVGPENELARRVKPGVEIFMQTTGNIGFAPVDMAVGPAGDLFVAIGGRGTRGGVFRVRYVGELDKQDRAEPLAKLGPRERVLRAPQPLAAWSRAKWKPLAKEVGREPFEKAVLDMGLSTGERLRAVEVLVEMFGGVPMSVAEELAGLGWRPIKPEFNDPRFWDGNADALVAARVAWAFGRAPKRDKDAQQFLDNLAYHKKAARLLAKWTFDNDTRLVRAAWEAMHTIPEDYRVLEESPDWRTLAAPDRRIAGISTAVAHRMKQDPNVSSWKFGPTQFEPTEEVDDAGQLYRRRMARQRLHRLIYPNTFTTQKVLDATFAAAFDTNDPHTALDGLRLVQLAAGGIATQPKNEIDTGYARKNSDQPFALSDAEITQVSRLATAGPHAEIRHEATRLLAMLEVDLERIPNFHRIWVNDISLTEDELSPAEDVHYLLVLARLPGKRPPLLTVATASTFVKLHGKMRSRGDHPSRNWPLRVGEVFERLCDRDPLLPDVMIATPGFGEPDHALFAARMQGEQRVKATKAILAAALEAGDDAKWNAQLVELVAELPDGAGLDALRQQWHRRSLRDVIVRALAKNPQEQDRARFVDALRSPQPAVAALAARALTKLDAADAQPADLRVAVTVLREACADPRQRDLRRAVTALLERVAGESFDIDENKAAGDNDNGGKKPDLFAVYKPCFAWFAAAYPDEAAKLSSFAGADFAAWRHRLETVPWQQGDAARGKVVFESRGCAACHVQAGKLGPDLAGAAARFSRDDLFAAIVDPNREVAPLYRVQKVTTRNGGVHHGIPVYASPDGTILQTGPNTTVRIDGEQFLRAEPSRFSLMPAGLLNEATDQELADLYAHLKTLK